jgi:hypothetical protein
LGGRELGIAMLLLQQRSTNLLQEPRFMNSKLLSCQKLDIPKALMADHDLLREQLLRATAISGQIGKAAERVAQLCLLHFAEEEEDVFLAIESLNRLAPGQTHPRKSATALRRMAKVSAKHLALRDPGRPIPAAIDELHRVALAEDNARVCELVRDLRQHEQIEDAIVYPTLIFFDATARKTLRE